MDLPESVTVLRRGDDKCYVLGTAHVSSQSVEDVESLIEAVDPDAVVVELCDARYESLSNPDKWKQMDIFKVIREGRGMLLVANLMLSSFQRRIGAQLGVKPGAEMVKAIELSEHKGVDFVLGDRNVQITLKRTWSGLSMWEKMKLLSSLFGSTFSGGSEKIDESELEGLKKKDVLHELLEDVGTSFPTIKERLIHERDLWLMSSIYNCPGRSVVAVVGAGHVPGITEHWGEAVNRQELNQSPSNSSPFSLIFKWGIPLVICLVFVYGFTSSDKGWDAIGLWFLANGVLSGVGAAAALGHPLTVLAAFVAAPFTSLNPMIAAGWVSGLTEAFVRKPKVSDCEGLMEATSSLKGWYGNRITRVLLVVILSNVGSMLGTWIGALGVVKIIG